MIELVILNFLKTKLDIPVVMEHQPNLPKRYILIEKTSSKRDNLLKSSVIAIQSYAESLYEAAKLNEKIKDIIDQLVFVDEVSGVRLNSDYNYTDTETKHYRYQAVFDIKHY